MSAAQTLTQAPVLSVLGGNSSGEVEPVLFSLADGLWLGLGSDHTDRKAETMGIALSKQLCGKPVAGVLWRLADVEGHWDEIEMRAFAVIDGQRVLYQQGTLKSLRTPSDLLSRRPDGPELTHGHSHVLRYARRDRRHSSGEPFRDGVARSKARAQDHGRLRHRDACRCELTASARYD